MPLLSDFTSAVGSLFRSDAPAPQLSRRSFLAGLGVVAAAAAAGPALLSGTAEAAPMSPIPADDLLDKELNLAQWDRRRDDDRDRGRGRDHDRGRDRDRDRRRDRRQRYSRRDLARRCDRDWRFRRDNRGLCARATGRGRAGACVEFGPVLICD